jgi:shikimate dehydrogenase
VTERASWVHKGSAILHYLAHNKNMVYAWRDAPGANYAVIGDPVKHSRSPVMHSAAYRALGLDLSYVAIEVPPGEVGLALDHLRTLGYLGVNVTVPHKEEVLGWCAQVPPFAARVRAANTIRLSDQSCINTDAPGFLEVVRDAGIEHPTEILLIGAGGSARALALALTEAGHELRIFNRTRSRAEAMIEDLALDARLLETPDPAGAELIINTTSASLYATDLDVDWHRAPEDALVIDLMYGLSLFLASAEGHGLRTMDGLPLLVAQGALSFEWWLGMNAPREAMREAALAAA